MKKEQFLEDLVDIFQTEDEIGEDTELASLEEWDSLSKMALQTYFKRNFRIQLSFEQLSHLKYVRDIIALAGIVE